MTLTKEQRERIELARKIDKENGHVHVALYAPDLDALLAAFDEAQSALRFYAKHDSWMAISDRSDAPRILLCAHGDTNSTEGWAMAEAAIAATNAQAGGEA